MNEFFCKRKIYRNCTSTGGDTGMFSFVDPGKSFICKIYLTFSDQIPKFTLLRAVDIF